MKLNFGVYSYTECYPYYVYEVLIEELNQVELKSSEYCEDF